MAEAYLNSTKSQTKKRKINENAVQKNKKSMDIVTMMSATSSANNQQHCSSVDIQSNKAPEVIRKNYHLGGKRYLVFYGPSGHIEDIILKEWDGQKVTNQGVKLNVSRYVMILHNVEIINRSIDKILKGDRDISQKINLGGGYYLTCNSPYKTIGIRLWKNNATGDLYPTEAQKTLKYKEWQEFVKIGNQMFSERVELFIFVPCLIQEDPQSHNKLTCPVCGHIEPLPQGRLNLIFLYNYVYISYPTF